MKQVRILFLLGLFFFPESALPPVEAVLSTKREIPEFLETGRWFRTEPLHLKDLKGKVILIHFWSFASAASLRDLVYLDEWRYKYNDYGLQIIGVHSPHYSFEFFETALENNIMDLRILYPVVQDANQSLWRSFNNLEKPAMYFIDGLGNIRESFYGNGDYERKEKLIQDLLKESGGIRLEDNFKLMDPQGFYPESKSGEIPLGFKNLSYFGNREPVKIGKPNVFHKPEGMDLGFFYLEGKWQFEEDHIVCASSDCWLGVKNSSDGFNLAAGSKAPRPIPSEITLNGLPLSKMELAKDTVLKDGKSFFDADTYRLYRLIKIESNPALMTVGIRFSEPGAELYAISFGFIPEIKKRREGSADGTGETAPADSQEKQQGAGEKPKFELTTTLEEGTR